MPNNTPEPEQPHEPPTAPTSPLAKRPKTNKDDSNTTMSASSNPPSTTTTTTIEQSPPLLIQKLSDKARTPTRGSAHSAGYDLYSARPGSIPARGKALIDTDLAIAVPAGTYGRVAPRSGLASKNFIDTGAGVIDADYRGPLKVLLFNHSEVDFEVKEGDRIAQLIVERATLKKKIYTPEIVVVERLEESVRGAGGFGSTGN